MEPPSQTPVPERPRENDTATVRAAQSLGTSTHPAQHPDDLSRFFIGDNGLRCGWSALLFVGLYYLLLFAFDVVALSLAPGLAQGDFAPLPVLVSELVPFTALLGAAIFMAHIEGRSFSAYSLVDAHKARHFAAGLIAGFTTLSLLVAVLALGGWLRFGQQGPYGVAIVIDAALWICAFLLIGLFEEGFFRCYLLSTLARGINFWWALATVAALCLLLFIAHDGKGAAGVFTIAAIGVVPGLLVYRSNTAGSNFWQAAWVTSTAFAYFHTNNGGENAIGIFAAGLVGFVFCASVRLTGSVWWAIGCHAAWDWAETFFYGTPDSGFAPQHHLLTTSPAGRGLWSGGSDGPEGSLLVVPVILLLLAFLFAVYRARPPFAGRGARHA